MAAFLKDQLVTDTPYLEPMQQDFARCMHIHFQAREVYLCVKFCLPTRVKYTVQ